MLTPFLLLASALCMGWVLGLSACWRRGAALAQVSVNAAISTPAAAFGFLSLTFFTLRITGHESPDALSVVSLAALAAVLFTVAGIRGSSSGTPKKPDVARLTPLELTTHIAAALALAGSLVAILILVKANPHGSWDGMAIWNFLARTLARVDGDLAELLSRLRLSHPEYPHHLPGSIAALHRLQGNEELLFQGGVAISFFLGLVSMVYVWVARFNSRVMAATAVALLLVCPFVARTAANQTADLPISYLYLGAAAGLASQFAKNSGMRFPPVVAGFFLGLLPWTKNEGVIMASALSLTFLILLLFRARPGQRPAALIGKVALGAAGPVAAVVAFKLMWGPKNPLMQFSLDDLVGHLIDPARWQAVWNQLWQELSTGGEVLRMQSGGLVNQFKIRWGSTWLAIGALVLLAARPMRLVTHRPMAFLAVAISVQFMAYFLLYVVIPFRQTWHLQTSMSRLMLHVLPTLIVLTCSLVPLGETSSAATLTEGTS